MPMVTVVFACIQNAGRSQMAAAFFNALADPAKAHAVSAGTRPADRVHPEVAATMRELGMDLGAATPTRLTDDLARSADVLVTMGCGETCPLVPGLRRIEWDVADPHGAPADRVREIRDLVRAAVARLVADERWGAS